MIHCLSKRIVIVFIVYCICLCNLLEVYDLASFGSVLRVPFQFIIIALLISNVFFRSVYERPFFYRNVVLFFSMFFLLLYLFIQILLGGSGYSSYLNAISNSTFSIIVFLAVSSSLSSDKLNERKFIECISAIFFFIYVCLYVMSFVVVPQTADPKNLFHAQFVNSIYYLIFCLPFLMNSKKKTFYFALAFMCCLLSRKQGAFVALLAGYMLYVMISQKMSQKSLTIDLKRVLLMLMLFGGASYAYVKLSEYLTENIFYGFYTMTVDGGNGRVDIYESVISAIQESDVVELLFGHGGYDSVSRFIGISAHNDFLEIFFDYGIVGLASYGLVLCSLIYCAYDMYKSELKESPAFVFAIVTFIVVSCVSHLIFILKYALLIFAYFGLNSARKEEFFL